MQAWNASELSQISRGKLYISPLRDDGITLGTPTWIWHVVVDKNLFVRAYNGIDSRWYKSAIKNMYGEIIVDDIHYSVEFTTESNPTLLKIIDTAYKDKYTYSPYLEHMISNEPTRIATVKIIPR